MEKEWKDDDPYILMVDQLWMVMLEDGMWTRSRSKYLGSKNTN
jgi:hypothetical protein